MVFEFVAYSYPVDFTSGVRNSYLCNLAFNIMNIIEIQEIGMQEFVSGEQE